MYLVTGVGGQLASKVADEMLNLLPAEELIFSASDISRIKPENLKRWREKGVDIRQANYDDIPQMKEAFEGVDRMLLVSTWEIGPIRRKQHANAIQAAKEKGVKYIAYTSFIGADIAENTPLVASDHRDTEQNILASGMQWNFIRNSLYFDSLFQLFAPLAANFGNKWRGNTGDVKSGYVAREDCSRVAAAVLAGKAETNQAYEVTGAELLSEKDLCQMVCDYSGWPGEYIEMTDEELYAYWDSQGVPREVTGDFSNSPVPFCSDDLVQNGASVRSGHFVKLTDTVEKLTGHKPQRAQDIIGQYEAFLPTA
ncbi:NAD(P)H-binding protein [Haliea sp. AH-315-K21]|uniref:NAD(P)-dependent oxidoreductase n=1 Tax=SAR86 cluster bacterium TaxID=2030880 RepID=A0A2A5CCH8_9GAMM|nr:NAD(P)H-binding protein [Haliea sp. AH-315-K21]PCJ41228.1 MAG: NAD(P)-dependent oxidoreductase [SAR86 cluster bacterium]